MVTMNGEECHNEWEITFEEIHRNGEIAHAIYDYVRYTGDADYLAEYGLELLIAVSRFWRQRCNFSKDKNQYVILGVTGPNEYENNVSNNWHTNNMAAWTLQYTLDAINFVKEKHPEQYTALAQKTNLNETEETKIWQDIVQNMYYPVCNEKGIFLQQDGFLDKELMPISALNPAELPIHQHWSWDRILRSCFIKQADVLQSLYFFSDQYSKEVIKRNFDFYEPMTVHESSLSPCVHAVLAARLGYQEKAYELYLRTARLDLDNYNNDTEDGCHITSMAGSWMAIVQGFGGMQVKDNQLHFAPFIPSQWQSYSFKIRFRGFLLKIMVMQKEVRIENETKTPLDLMLFGKNYTVTNEALTVAL